MLTLQGLQKRIDAFIQRLNKEPPTHARAIARLRRDFDQPLRIKEMACELGMSVSQLQRSFKAVTEMSPLQFQKQLRLQEARRLMLGEGLDAASAGYRVGYSDASHFTRDYKRLFGAPPVRDVEQLRNRGRERVVGQGSETEPRVAPQIQRNTAPGMPWWATSTQRTL